MRLFCDLALEPCFVLGTWYIKQSRKSLEVLFLCQLQWGFGETLFLHKLLDSPRCDPVPVVLDLRSRTRAGDQSIGSTLCRTKGTINALEKKMNILVSQAVRAMIWIIQS